MVQPAGPRGLLARPRGQRCRDRRRRVQGRPHEPDPDRALPIGQDVAPAAEPGPGDRVRRGRGRAAGGTSDFSIESVRVLASQVTLDSALVESFNKVLLSGRSLVFSYPTMHTQVSNVPSGVTSHNVTVARAYTKLMGAFVTFRQTTDSLGECRNLEYPGPAAHPFNLEGQMQLGGPAVPALPDRQLK